MNINLRRAGGGSERPSSRSPRTSSCGHVRHIGCCPACQRVQLARWAEQLREAQEARLGHGPASPAGL
jgi:hypothetical protein